MFNNDNITLFNIVVDEEGLNQYKKTYIRGVDWQSKQAIAISATDKGFLSADVIKIFIDKPYNSDGKKYVKPKEFYRNDKEGFFTFKEGDIIVKGIIDFNITADKSSNVKMLNNLYDDVVTIISVVELDDHFEIGCK